MNIDELTSHDSHVDQRTPRMETLETASELARPALMPGLLLSQSQDQEPDTIDQFQLPVGADQSAVANEAADDSAPEPSTSGISHAPTDSEPSLSNLHQDPPVQQQPPDSDEHQTCFADTRTKDIHTGGSAKAALTKPLTVKASLGIMGCVVIFAGSIGILLLIAFLAYLWFGYGNTPEATNATWIWRQIAIRDWMTRTITICALALRTLLSFQTIYCTSMLASLILEKCFVRRSQVACLSLLRGLNSGPFTLAQIILSSKTLAMARHIEVWLVLLLFILSTLLQFTSTLLVSDLHNYSVVGNSNHTSLASLVGLDQVAKLDNRRFSILQDPDLSSGFSIFGETQQASFVSVEPNANGLSSTGLVERGLLPLASVDERMAVRYYNGTSMILSSAVSCMRPVITGQYAQFSTTGSSSGVGTVKGSLDVPKSLQQALGTDQYSCESGQCEVIYFACDVPASVGGGPPAPAVCILNGDDTNVNKTYSQNVSAKPWEVTSFMWLVFSSKVSDDQWASIPEASEGRYELPASAPFNESEWEEYPLFLNASILITLCFSDFNIEQHNVSMKAPKPTREPIVQWSVLSGTSNASDAQSYFGATSPALPLSDRGILEMDILDLPLGEAQNQSSVMTTAEIIYYILYYQLGYASPPNTTFVACWQCLATGSSSSPKTQALFQGIINSTNRAAPALHTWISVAAFASYYEVLPSMNGFDNVIIQSVVETKTPGPCTTAANCAGFITVTTLLGIYLLVVLAITLLFLRRARFSRVSNIWHTFAQLVGEELNEILACANQQPDDKVVEMMQKQGNDDFVMLSQVKHSEMVEITKFQHHGSLNSRATTGEPQTAPGDLEK